MKTNYEFIIIGAGIVGLTIARELFLRGHKDILILEKEVQIGMHTSGKNSGVLHAGIYYSTDSLKAQVCSAGAKLMKEYARQKKINMKETGKVIVAYKESQIPELEKLYNRAVQNNIRVEKIDKKQLAELEPEAFTLDWAISSPDTAVIDSKSVLINLEQDLVGYGVDIKKTEGAKKIDLQKKTVETPNARYSYNYVINCAGLHADTVAHWFGVGTQYRILPFKGLYYKLKKEVASRVRASIYPTPDLGMPFLGVHITKVANDEVYIGPTAIPAFGRENYHGLKGTNLIETPVMFKDLLVMLLQNKDNFRKYVSSELNKYSFNNFYEATKALAPHLKPEDLEKSDKVGIRAQLIDTQKMKLVMDFLVEKGPNSIHVLNAISPAFTSSFAFAKKIADQVLQ